MTMPSILFKTLATASKGLIGCVTLNKPKALNALDLEMVEAMHQQLSDWQNDAEIQAVLIDSSGDKAFCAGGDIVSMYKAMRDEKQTSTNSPPAFIAQFFAQEYRLNYQIHAFTKPIICWGNGIIMGGGLGVFAGASTKIVTERSNVAMPEITIGLFPDVGASYFLNKMPPGIGKFLGLTGTSINALDCLAIGLADYYLPSGYKEVFVNQLLLLDVVDQKNINLLCKELELPGDQHTKPNTDEESLAGKLVPFIQEISPLEDIQNAEGAKAFITKLANAHPDSKLLERAYKSLIKGSPITAHLVMQQLLKSKNLSLGDCFRMELSMAYQCSVIGEFEEGVRALLIDKDNQAIWQYASISLVPSCIVEEHFNRFSNTPEQHPLADLEHVYGEYHAN